MAESDDTILRLEGLIRDLISLKDHRLEALDRIQEELGAHVEPFQKVIDHPPKSEASRKKVKSGDVTIGEDEYNLNESFQDEALRLSDDLELDELEAVKLYLEGQQEASNLDRSPYETSIIRFHTRRQFTLECLRLLFEHSSNPDLDYNDDVSSALTIDLAGPAEAEAYTIISSVLTKCQEQVLQISKLKMDGPAKFWNKCFVAMGSVERDIQKVTDKKQRIQVLGEGSSTDKTEILDYQLNTLTLQHECLSAISTYLIRDRSCSLPDFKLVIGKLQNIEKHDIILLHHIPIVMAFSSFFGARDSSLSDEDVGLIHKMMTSIKEESWTQRNLHAAAMLVWLSDYAGRDFGVDREEKLRDITDLFSTSLKEGSFQYLLSLCKDIQDQDWPDFATTGLLSILLQDTSTLPADRFRSSDYMRTLILRLMQRFISSTITNLPDALRMLKDEEDENSHLLQTKYQRDQKDYYHVHLERFMAIMSYSYKGFPVAALDFWNATNGNLYGFLHWASERQTTPRAAAFCELLISLSESEECANHAHQFLYEHGTSHSSKLRRSATLSWVQILRELEFYSSFINNKQTSMSAGNGNQFNNPNAHAAIEPEAKLMIECYLRLIAHMCEKSPEARKWLMTDSKYPMSEVLFQVCSTGNESVLRASAFKVFTSMLTDRSDALTKITWSSLDHWIYTTNRWQTYMSLELEGMNEIAPFVAVANSIEEADAFVDLVNALMTPISSDHSIHDELPFPETLGASYRMPGVSGYIDFIVGKLFGDLSRDLDDSQKQHQILRYKCLKLVATCLSTFNDDLVVISILSNIKVDSAIQTSSLSAYIRLHPFARVMEWLFNDRVLKTLFQTVRQDIDRVNEAAETSPLIQSLTTAVEIIYLITKLQSTYLDFVRTFPKEKDAPEPPSPVANVTLASFEDAVLNNLEIVVDLGLYAGTGHERLSIQSLKVLEKLCSSRKLVTSISQLDGYTSSEKSRIIGIVERNRDDYRISKALSMNMQLDFRELEAGPEVPAYQLKLHLLDFLYNGLNALSDRPTLAHILLGFNTSGNTLVVQEDGLFASGDSLFHSIVRLGVDYPIVDPETESVSAWMGAIRFKCADILRSLWRYATTASYVMAELRTLEYAFALAGQNVQISQQTVWEGKSIMEQGEFFLSPSAQSLAYFLGQRAIFYDYCARELRISRLNGMSAHLDRMQSMILGTTKYPDGETVHTLSIFQLFDFLELDLPNEIVLPQLEFFEDINFSICEITDLHVGKVLDQGRVEEMLSIKMQEISRSANLTPKDEEDMNVEYMRLVSYAHAKNGLAAVLSARRSTLTSWINLLTVFLETCDLSESDKTQFILQALKAVMPKLEKTLLTSMETATALIKACKSLLKHIDTSLYGKYRNSADASNDMLFQLFRIAISGIINYDSKKELREGCQHVAYVYLRSVMSLGSELAPQASPDPSASLSMSRFSSTLVKPSSGLSPSFTQNIIRILKTNVDRLVEVLCDDVQSGPVMSRFPAILLLDMMVLVSMHEKADFIINSMVRLNFLGLLVDSIKQIPTELGSADSGVVPELLLCYSTILSLLLRVCCTRAGATHVLSIGLFTAIRESAIFSTDPDIGLEIENPSALRRFFQLMLSLLRIVNAVVVSRGTHNERVLQQARAFLTENRSSIVSILKRRAGIGRAMALIDGTLKPKEHEKMSRAAAASATGGLLGRPGLEGDDDGMTKEQREQQRKDKDLMADLVDNFLVLITVTGFVEFEDALLPRQTTSSLFS